MYKFKIKANNNNGDYMDIQEALSIIPRSIVSLVSLFIATKILGKKQVSQLSLFDYCIGISIGNFTAEMILVVDSQLINGVVAIITFGIIGYLISIISMKSIVLRRFFIGVPTVIIQDGQILYKPLKKQNMDINDVLEQARSSGYFNLKEISYAIMEANGKISFLEKDAYKNPTKKDLKLKKEKEILPANIIIDGNLMIDNIKDTDKSKEWFIDELKKQGYRKYNNILLATYQNNNIDIYTKHKNKKPKEILE